MRAPTAFVQSRYFRAWLTMLLLGGVLLGICSTETVRAGSFAVTVDHQQDNNNPACVANGTPPCSLRDAVLFASSHTGVSDLTTITLPPGTYILTQLGPGDNSGLTGDLDFDGNTTIVGAGAATTIIDGDATAPINSTPDRIFDIASGSFFIHLSVSGVTLQNGKTPSNGGGGGILNAGVLTLTDCILTGNVSQTVGGAIFSRNGGSATLVRTTVSGNVAAQDSGGLRNDVSAAGMTLTDSVVMNNTAGTDGGGIFNQQSTLTLTGTTVSGNTASNGFGGGIDSSGTLTVTGGSFSGNHANGMFDDGGAIANLHGTLTITGSVLSSNTADDRGGGIYNIGTLTITNATFTNNTAADALGGGIDNEGGALTVMSSTFSGNSVSGTGAGGGIENSSFGTATVTNSTFSANSAGYGGGISNGGTLTMTNDSFSGNTAASGGGIDTPGMLTITNTIVANSPTGGDVVRVGGTLTGGHNLIDDAASAGGFVDGTNGNIVGHPALLGTLGDNGGPTQTITLLTGSPAIAHGDPAICNQPGTGNVGGVDQRGVTRPSALCAIGAVEPLLSAISPASGSTAGGNRVTLTGAGFAAGATVTIGDLECTSIQIPSSTTLTCVVGAHVAGAVDVVVTVGTATGILANGYTYGTVNPLAGTKPSGGSVGAPGNLPNPRAAGADQSGPPNPLPNPRP